MAELYSAMILLVMHDVIVLYAMTSMGFGAFPLVYQLLPPIAVGYEGCVLLVSRRAHMKRLNMKVKH